MNEVERDTDYLSKCMRFYVRVKGNKIGAIQWDRDQANAEDARGHFGAKGALFSEDPGFRDKDVWTQAGEYFTGVTIYYDKNRVWALQFKTSEGRTIPSHSAIPSEKEIDVQQFKKLQCSECAAEPNEHIVGFFGKYDHQATMFSLGVAFQVKA
ncbi:MAG: hypothetical protein M3460_11830 [Actinomycetota bacterium]|nr:hypothetical protein [Actinomycetota bacterium]